MNGGNGIVQNTLFSLFHSYNYWKIFVIESGKGKSDPKQKIERPDKPITVALSQVYSH